MVKDHSLENICWTHESYDIGGGDGAWLPHISRSVAFDNTVCDVGLIFGTK